MNAAIGPNSFLLAVAIFLSWHTWILWTDSLGREQKAFDIREWFFKGALTPLVLWGWMNSGWFFGVTSLSPEIHSLLIHSNWKWVPDPRVFIVLALHWGLILTCWVLATHVWIGTRVWRQIEDKKQVVLTWGVWTGLALIPSSLAFIALGWTGLPTLIGCLSATALHFSLPMMPGKQAPPQYSQAIAKLKFGKFEDSESEILRQLEKQPEDFEGWMMLAELMATRFHELDEATQIIDDLVNQPTTTPFQACQAYHRLADWHLKLDGNVESACLILEQLCKRYPGSHAARMARQRIDQIRRDATSHEETRKIRLQTPATTAKPLEETTPISDKVDRFTRRQIERLQKRLNEYPADHSSREALATLYAESLGDTQIAADQIEIILRTPKLPRETVSRLLHQLASWHIMQDQDIEKARVTLQRIERQLPNTVFAQDAKTRIQTLSKELERRQSSLNHKKPQTILMPIT